MTTIIVATRAQVADLFLERIPGFAHCLIPAGTEQRWRDAGIRATIHPIRSWTDYNELARIVAALPAVERVIGTDEGTLVAAAFLRAMLGVPGQDLTQAVAFTDKAVMKNRLSEAGIPVARWQVVHALPDVVEVGNRFGWPVVVKPRRGFAALRTTVVTDAEHLDQLIVEGRFDERVPKGDLASALRSSGVYDRLDSSPDGFLVERCIDVAAEFSCDAVVWDGDPRLTLVTRYLTSVIEAADGGQALEFLALEPGDPSARAVEALTRRAMAALGLTRGQVHCEVFRTRGGDYVLGEIACRVGGSALPVLSEVVFGVSTVAAALDLAFDRMPPRAGERVYGGVATIGVPLPPGLVEAVPTREELESLPAVLRADIRVQKGDRYGGDLGSCGAAAYLYIESVPEKELAVRMAEIRDRAAPLFTVLSDRMPSPS